MSQEDAAIIGRGITKSFNDFWGRPKVHALKNIDITVPKGCIFGLLGPNGAGKSTLIKIILGHLHATKGNLLVLNKPPRDVESKYRIGYLPERSYLYKNLTARETLKYFGELLNLSKDQIESRSEQLLKMVGLGHAADRQVGEFSHGMTRRMGMAQCLLNDPDLIILDEPTAGLDPIGCREVKDLILTLGKRGKTILLTSHLLADVEDVSDHVMVIFGGAVQKEGDIHDLLSDRTVTQLTFPKIANSKLQEAKAIIQSAGASEIIENSPVQSLESFFLNIVYESSKNNKTSGAQMGEGVADYLKDSTIETPEIPKEEKPEAEKVKVEQPKTSAKVESPKAEEVKVEVPKAEAKVETPKPEISKAQGEKVEEPKVAELKIDEASVSRPDLKVYNDDEDELAENDDEEVDFDLLDELTK